MHNVMYYIMLTKKAYPQSHAFNNIKKTYIHNQRKQHMHMHTRAHISIHTHYVYIYIIYNGIYCIFSRYQSKKLNIILQ